MYIYIYIYIYLYIYIIYLYIYIHTYIYITFTKITSRQEKTAEETAFRLYIMAIAIEIC